MNSPIPKATRSAVCHRASTGTGGWWKKCTARHRMMDMDAHQRSFRHQPVTPMKC